MSKVFKSDGRTDIAFTVDVYTGDVTFTKRFHGPEKTDIQTFILPYYEAQAFAAALANDTSAWALTNQGAIVRAKLLRAEG
jgi:hypothetical protein